MFKLSLMKTQNFNENGSCTAVEMHLADAVHKSSFYSRIGSRFETKCFKCYEIEMLNAIT